MTDTTDYLAEFLEERPGLWPEHQRDQEASDPFAEFGTEMDAGEDRWLHAARGRVRTPPAVHNYRHMLAVASVVLSLFTPAGVISTVIVGRELTVSPMDMWHALPPLPARLLTTSVDRLVGIPAFDNLPTPPRPPTGSPTLALRGDGRENAVVPAADTPATPPPLLPLTTALLSTPIAPGLSIVASPPPVRSVPPPAPVSAPPTAAPPPAPTASSPTPGDAPGSSSVPAAPPTTPVPSAAVDSAAVRTALDRYREAFSTLDAGRAKSVWPAVDERTLARAFSQMSRQEFVFDACSVDVSGPRATASCRGRAQYVPKVGSRTARVEPRNWTFTLRRAETAWTIESVDSR